MPFSDDVVQLPDLAEVFGRVLMRVPRARQPLLVAIAERLAAERYRGWASEAAEPARRRGLLACAEREDRIADRVEALFHDAASIQHALLIEHPDLEELNRSVFAGRPLGEQFTIQARGERLGAATWRAFAEQEDDGAVRDAFLACAELEEESARFLEGLLGAVSPPL